MQTALFGYGYWGKKIATNFIGRETSLVIVDPAFSDSEESAFVFKKATDVLCDSQVTDCLIATPEETHFSLIKECLLNNKNVFVEKPFCLQAAEARELIDLAQKNNKKLYVDYTFLFDEYVHRIKEILTSGKIGELQSIFSVRHSVNTDKPRISVTDDLAIHDIYLGQFWLEAEIQTAEIRRGDFDAQNKKRFQSAQVTYHYEKGVDFKADYSWVQQTPQRKMTFKGSQGELIWDRTAEGESLEIFEVLDGSRVSTSKEVIKRNISPLKASLDYFFALERENQQEKNKRYQEYMHDVQILETLRLS